MNKSELLKEFNSKVEDLRQELLEKLKLIDEKNDRFQVALPKEFDTFYYIDDHKVFVARIISAKQDWAKIFYK